MAGDILKCLPACLPPASLPPAAGDDRRGGLLLAHLRARLPQPRRREAPHGDRQLPLGAHGGAGLPVQPPQRVHRLRDGARVAGQLGRVRGLLAVHEQPGARACLPLWLRRCHCVWLLFEARRRDVCVVAAGADGFWCWHVSCAAFPPSLLRPPPQSFDYTFGPDVWKEKLSYLERWLRAHIEDSDKMNMPVIIGAQKNPSAAA